MYVQSLTVGVTAAKCGYALVNEEKEFAHVMLHPVTLYDFGDSSYEGEEEIDGVEEAVDKFLSGTLKLKDYFNSPPKEGEVLLGGLNDVYESGYILAVNESNLVYAGTFLVNELVGWYIDEIVHCIKSGQLCGWDAVAKDV